MSSLCEEAGEEGAEKRKEVGLHLVDWNRTYNSKVGEEFQNKAREHAKAKGEICVATSTLPPSMVSKIQEGGSVDIAFR